MSVLRKGPPSWSIRQARKPALAGGIMWPTAKTVGKEGKRNYFSGPGRATSSRRTERNSYLATTVAHALLCAAYSHGFRRGPHDAAPSRA